MAGGKENARQKMINLMYLVFIAILALNMSKEVLMTFGEIEREVTKSTKSLKESNKAALQVIKNSAKNDSLQWYTAYQPISKIAEAANELTDFINKTENEFVNPYEVNKVTYQSFKRPILAKYEFLDQLFVKVLKNHTNQMPDIFFKLFDQNNQNSVIRFLSSEGSLLDDMKIISKMPKLLFLKNLFN